MDEMDEKAVVRIDSDGAVMKCAKGAGDACGYKAGAKVCGKCGAMAVQAKKADMDEMDDVEEEDVDVPLPRRKKRMDADADVEMVEDDEDDEDMVDEDPASRSKKKGMGGGYAGMGDELPPKKKAKRGVAMGNPDELDEDDTPDPSAEEMDESGDAPDESNGEMGETPVEAMNDNDRKRRMAARRRRMASMNVKSEDWAEDAYLCGFESKMLAGDSAPCAACPGGCAPEADLPTLLEVQGLAEEIIGGKVLDSGYADERDLFVVDVQRKDGKIAEAIFDGTTAECLGWSLLDDNLIGEKSAQAGFAVVSSAEAAEIATKSLPGEVLSVDADVFEGFDVYAVEISGADGKSYDGFVSLDGELLGYDEYTADEAAAIDEQTAEYALKAMYSEEERMEMAKRGMALEDGSYPIKNIEDLKNAIQAYGRAKDKNKARVHIMKRAEALRAYNLIPESWAKEVLGADAVEKSADVVVVAPETDPEFMANLMEFELLAADDDLA